MDIAVPHRGRWLQTKELSAILMLANPDCAVNGTLLHHLETLGWRFTD
jgi:hypothetical protein